MSDKLEILKKDLEKHFMVDESEGTLLVTVPNPSGLVNVFTAYPDKDGFTLESRDGTALGHFADPEALAAYLARFGSFPAA